MRILTDISKTSPSKNKVHICVLLFFVLSFDFAQDGEPVEPFSSLLSTNCKVLAGVSVGRWGRFEASMQNTRKYRNPYGDVTLKVTYKSPNGNQIKFWGFYDGGQTWKIRFMPEEVGTWKYNAVFSDGSDGISGVFECVRSDVPGMISVDETNPIWFGYKGGKHVLIRSFHVGDRFFAENWPSAKRKAF